MRLEKFFQFLLLVGTALFMLSTLLFFKQGKLPLFESNHHSNLIAQNTNTYLGPNRKVPGNPELIRVQVLLYNDPDPTGVKIESVHFDGTKIPLKPRDIYGYRGQASFQKKPGKYILRWVAERDPVNWPRTVEREEEVLLSPKDFWIQITIVGESAEIS